MLWWLLGLSPDRMPCLPPQPPPLPSLCSPLLQCRVVSFQVQVQEQQQQLQQQVQTGGADAPPGVAVTFTSRRRLKYGQVLKLVGSAPQMGRWDARKAPGEPPSPQLHMCCRLCRQREATACCSRCQHLLYGSLLPAQHRTPPAPRHNP